MTPPSPLFPPSPPGLENFVAGQNLQALVAARAVARGEVRDSVYLWGPKGGGKSHLLRAAAEEARTVKISAVLANAESDSDSDAGPGPDSNPAQDSNLDSAPDSNLDLGPNLGPGPNSDSGPNTKIGLARARIPAPFAGLLAADNVDAVSADGEVALFDWFNRPRESHFILLAGNCAPRELPLRPELQTRIGGGLMFRLRALSDADKGRALALFAGRRGFALPEDIAELMLARLPRDMAKLTAALADLDAFLAAGGKKLTARAAREWLALRGDAVFGNPGPA